MTAIRATISVRLPWPAGEARSLDDDQPVSLQSEGGKTTFGKTLAGGETWIARIRRG